jgi:integrase
VIKYEIETTTIKSFTYKLPIVNATDDGELQIHYSKKNDSYKHIKQITFLNLVGRDENGDISSFESMQYINLFLMAHHIYDDKEESEQLSKAMVNFFSYLIALQKRWDDECDQDLYEEGVDEPRPKWDYFCHIQSKRITYKYRQELKESVLNRVNGLSPTTASNYMRAVIKFYMFHIKNGYSFNNPPFEHEMITVYYNAGSTSMKSKRTKLVHTSDLRLNFPKSKRNDGGNIEHYRRDLRPLTNQEWTEVETILTKSKKIIKSVNGKEELTKLADEYCLFFRVSRYTAMRREEVASLHCGQIIKPKTIIENGVERFLSPIVRIGIGAQYGSLTKTVDGGNKSRVTIIPSSLMQQLYEYTCSVRYINRLSKFHQFCEKQRAEENNSLFNGVDAIDETKHYLFIQQSGIPTFRSLANVNARWSEIRNTVNRKLDKPMLGSPHNLRATFAINLFRLLLKRTSSDKALAYVSSLLGHEDLKTTLMYLQIAENYPTGDEIYEDLLDWVGVFDDLDVQSNLDEDK